MSAPGSPNAARAGEGLASAVPWSGPLGGPRLHLVRHGQSTWNVRGLVQGQTPHPELTELGRQQAQRAADLLVGVGVVRLLTSDLRRAVQTAEIIGTAIALPPTPTGLLREQSMGRLEGLPTEQAVGCWELAAAETDAYGDPLPAADVRIGGGESMADVLARAGALLASPWMTDAAGDVVMVTHGDVIRILLAHLLGDDPDDQVWREVRNGEVHSVYRSPEGQVRYARDGVPVSALSAATTVASAG